MSDYWTEYWKHGHLTSFGSVFQNNYPAILADGWKHWLKTLRSPGLVLDIGTGNGALIDMALDTVPTSTQLIGVDAAQLSVSDNLKSQTNVSFFEKTKAENLPLEDKAASAAMAQFGLEYADLKKAVPEIARVLTAGANFRFITHFQGSMILKPNHEILTAVDYILKKNGLIDKISKLVKTLHKQGAGSSAAEKARNQLNEQLGAFLKLCTDEGIQGTNLQQFLKSVMDPKQVEKTKVAMLASYKSEMMTLQKRLKDLTSAALSESEISDLRQLLQTSGLTVTADKPVLTEDQQTLGWLLEGIKAET